jgi:competence protein ComEA
VSERAQRVVLFLLISLLFGLQWKSHGTSPPETPMAFVHYSAGSVSVRVDGDVALKGIHKFYDGDILMTAIKMTAPDIISATSKTLILQQKIPQAAVVTVNSDREAGASFSIKPMNINDMLLLGIPLNPDRLTASEWEVLPGIGPSLARAIISDRHINGAFGTVVALERVPGIGKAKVSEIIKYF